MGTNAADSNTGPDERDGAGEPGSAVVILDPELAADCAEVDGVDGGTADAEASRLVGSAA
jgi:hypothetical protein